jgi:hypothetical protein
VGANMDGFVRSLKTLFIVIPINTNVAHHLKYEEGEKVLANQILKQI